MYVVKIKSDQLLNKKLKISNFSSIEYVKFSVQLISPLGKKYKYYVGMSQKAITNSSSLRPFDDSSDLFVEIKSKFNLEGLSPSSKNQVLSFLYNILIV